MLPPLAGEKCVSCGEVIASYSEGSFCPECGNPAHNACQRQDAAGLADGKCARCHGDPQHPLAVEVRKEQNRSWEPGANAPGPMEELAGTSASQFSFAMVLVWVLRIMAGACLLILMQQINAIDEAATRAEKADKPFPEFTKDGEPKVSEPVRPNTSGALLAAVLTVVGAAAALLALAEILRMQVVILRKLDAPQDDEFTQDEMEPGSESAAAMNPAGSAAADHAGG
jgi:hypothetical protein